MNREGEPTTIPAIYVSVRRSRDYRHVITRPTKFAVSKQTKRRNETLFYCLLWLSNINLLATYHSPKLANCVKYKVSHSLVAFTLGTLIVLTTVTR